MKRSWAGQVEQLDSKVFKSRHDKSAVEEIVVLLAGGLGNEQATVASSTLEKAPLVRVLRLVLGTNRIIRAKLAHLQGLVHVLVDASAHFDETTEGSFGVRTARVKQHTVANARQAVDAFSD